MSDVDIEAAVLLARDIVAKYGDDETYAHARFARAVLHLHAALAKAEALATERYDDAETLHAAMGDAVMTRKYVDAATSIEQRTAERIAKWLDDRAAESGRHDHERFVALEAAAEAVRDGKWKERGDG